MKIFYVIIVKAALIILFLFPSTIQGQKHIIDSLYILLEKPQHDTTRAEVYYELGVAYHRSVPDSAMLFFEKSRDLAENILASKPSKAIEHTAKSHLAASLRGIGLVHLQYGDLSTALAYYTKSIEIYEKIDDKEGLAHSLNNIGMLYRRMGDTPKALEYYSKSAELYEKAENLQGTAIILNNIGFLHFRQGDLIEALENYEKSLRISKEINDKQRVAAIYSNLGSVYREQGNIIKALDCYNKSLLIRDEVNDIVGKSITINNIGRIYSLQGDYTKALENYIKSLELSIELNDKSGTAISYNNIGYVYYQLGDTAKALKNYNKSLELCEELEYKRRKVSLLINIGVIYKDKNDLEEAIKYFEQSYKLSEALKNRRDMATSLVNIGRVYFLQNNLATALTYAERAYHIGKEIGVPDNIAATASLLKDIYEKAGNYKKAYLYFTEAIDMRDSLVNAENLKETMRQQAKYEYQKRSIADSIKQAEENKLTALKLTAKDEQLKREAQLRYVFFLGFISLLALGTIMYHYYKQKKAANVLLSEQNKQINRKNLEITAQKDKIEKQNQTIIDSIKYAKRIQHALLPDESLLTDGMDNIKGVSDSFILFKPKEIVSGDFYWANRINDSLIVAVADCTGHGVPGAFMSMLGISFLNEIVNKQETIVANEILQHLKDNVISTLSQSKYNGDIDEPMDGMNIVITVIDMKSLNMQYSGSFNPFYLIRDNKLYIYKTDRNPIGIFARKKKVFTNNALQLQKDDALYLFSDGFFDQFDNTGRKRFKSENFRELLLEINHEPMSKQKQILEAKFEAWKGSYDQIDDVTVLGMRV